MTKIKRTWNMEIHCVGLQFRWKRDGRETLRRMTPFEVQFEREPENRHDENAVKVIIAPQTKLTRLDGAHLGYLRRTVAEVLAPKLDAGAVEVVKAWVTDVDVDTGDATMDVRFRDKPAAKRKTRT
jgi:HIRAN domain